MTEIFISSEFNSFSQKLVEYVSDKRVLLVTSSSGIARFNKYFSVGDFFSFNKKIKYFNHIQPNLSVAQVDNLLGSIKDFPFDLVIGFGGGSVMDAAKLCSAASCLNVWTVSGLLEANHSNVIYKPELVLIPTCFGSGSEVTYFSTIWDFKNKNKISISGESLRPNLTLVNWRLSASVPKEQLLNGALDSAAQALDSIWSRTSCSSSLEYSTTALSKSTEALFTLAQNGLDNNINETLQEASIASGLAISKTRTSLSHSISYYLTLNFGIAHGTACALTLNSIAKYALGSAKIGVSENKVLNSKTSIKLFEILETPNCVSQHLDFYRSKLVGQKIPFSSVMTPGRGDNFIENLSKLELSNICSQSGITIV